MMADEKCWCGAVKNETGCPKHDVHAEEIPAPCDEDDAAYIASEIEYGRQRRQERELRQITNDRAGYRCVNCRRAISWRFTKLGLGVHDLRFAHTPDGVIPIDNSHHTFPCKGRKVDLKSICADFLRLANMPPAGEMLYTKADVEALIALALVAARSLSPAAPEQRAEADWRRAIGAIPHDPDAPSSEECVRRGR